MPLGEILIQAGVLEGDQLARALKHQSEHGGRLGTVLIELELATQDEIAHGLARLHGVPATLHKHFRNVDPSALSKVPRELCNQYLALPIAYANAADGRRIVVCFRDPWDTSAISQVARSAQTAVIPAVAPELIIFRALEKYHEIPPPARFSGGVGGDPLQAPVLVDLDHHDVEKDYTQSDMTQLPKQTGLQTGEHRAVVAPSADSGDEAPMPPAQAATAPSPSNTFSLAPQAVATSGSIAPNVVPASPTTAQPAVSGGGSPTVAAPQVMANITQPKETVEVRAMASLDPTPPHATAAELAARAMLATDAVDTASLEPPPANVELAAGTVSATDSAELESAADIPPPGATAPGAWDEPEPKRLDLSAPAAEVHKAVSSSPTQAYPPAQAAETATQTMSCDEAAKAIAIAEKRSDIASALTCFMRARFGGGLIAIVKGDVALGHAGVGFFDARAVESIMIPLGSASMFQAAHASRQPFRGAPPAAGSAIQDRFFKNFDLAGPPEDVAVAPVVLGDRVVCLLYAHARAGQPIAESVYSEFERLTRVTEQAFLRIIQAKKAQS